jgi:Beta-propeller repeat
MFCVLGQSERDSAGRCPFAIRLYRPVFYLYTLDDVVPTTPGAFQPLFRPSHCPNNLGICSHSFVVKVAADGSHVLYATYIDGSGDDFAYAIAVDPSGNAYVVGTTTSTDFPVSASDDWTADHACAREPAATSTNSSSKHESAAAPSNSYSCNPDSPQRSQPQTPMCSPQRTTTHGGQEHQASSSSPPKAARPKKRGLQRRRLARSETKRPNKRAMNSATPRRRTHAAPAEGISNHDVPF